ncbi:MAG: hypothetical protein NVS3B26_24520 [Mycobacteriales bacterium]
MTASGTDQHPAGPRAQQGLRRDDDAPAPLTAPTALATEPDEGHGPDAAGDRCDSQNDRTGSRHDREPASFERDVAAAERERAAHRAAADAREIEGLRTAMESRATIGQAQGVLMARYELSAEKAWALLVRLSQQSNVKLRDLADSIVASTARGRT